MRSRLMTLAAAAATVAAIGILVAGIAASPTDAADHLDAPGLTPPGGNLMADVADLFVFPPPGKPHLVVLAATFNPAAGPRRRSGRERIGPFPQRDSAQAGPRRSRGGDLQRR